ncbi:hypothetical protein [Azospirillum sp. SYSU D00513]|uniref:hypothetical protein n=1 Tax=Azospirillum sp. SYSU D00513 TaxID=2812561 RepID=UPI001A96BEFD|nr:hypothetical protein [Azospirillum sp. SYSU D00513]
MIDDLADLMPDVVEHAPANGHDVYGAPSYGPASTYRARVAYRSRLVRDRNGDTVAARGSAWLAGAPVVGLDDRVTLPDGTSPPLLAVDRLTDERGATVVKIHFG